jgi:hypothetical protein
MTDTFTDAYEILDEFTYDVEQVITKIPDPSSDEDIAHTVQDVLFRDLGAGANYEKLKQVISIIYDHALPTGAQYDKILSLLVHIVRPKPEKFDLVLHDRVLGDGEWRAETLAYRFILSEVRIRESFTLWETEVWDRRLFDIAAEFAENYEHLEISESGLKKGRQTLFYHATNSKHLFLKVNFDLFARLVIDHGHLLDSVEAVPVQNTLHDVAKRAKSESLDMQLMAAGLLSIVKERRSARGGG